jgi:hypothetical protein
MLKRVSPDDTDFALHGIRVEGWNRAAADNAALAEAHGGWKPGNASRYSRFQLADVFTIFPKMVSPTGPTDVPMVACWPADDTPSDDGLADEEEDVEDEVEDDEDDEGDGDTGAGAMPPPGVPPAVPTQLADGQAGVAALPLLGQPVVAPVESEADGYVGAAIRMAILNTRASTFLSPTSRALARLRRTLE